MKLKSIAQIFTAGALALTATATFSKPSSAAPVRFVCGRSSTTNLPTVYAETPDGNKPIIRMYSQYFSGAGYTPERRCNEVASRFQNFYDNGSLNYITTGYVNNLPVICVASAHGSPCAGDTVLFTLKRGENASARIQRLFNIRAGASDVLYESADEAANPTAGIDFKKFLSATAVENGTSSRSSEPAAKPSSSVENNSEKPSQPSQPSTKPGGAW